VLVIGDQKWSDLVLVIPATIVITWVFLNALSSVLVVMVLHSLNNSVSGEYFSQCFEGSDSTRQSWWLVVVWAIAAALVVRLAPGFRKAPTPHEP
jgi:cobalamin synthase